jgi:hypothetical protein
MLLKIQGWLGKVFLREKRAPFGCRRPFSATPTQVPRCLSTRVRCNAFALRPQATVLGLPNGDPGRRGRRVYPIRNRSLGFFGGLPTWRSNRQRYGPGRNLRLIRSTSSRSGQGKPLNQSRPGLQKRKLGSPSRMMRPADRLSDPG